MAQRLEKLQLPTDQELEGLNEERRLSLLKEWRQRIEIYEGIIFRSNRRQYGRKSERSEPTASTEATPPEPRSDTSKLPSERYPEAEVLVDNINFSAPQVCPSCGGLMEDSGMAETSEYLDIRPKEFIVVEQRRHKHRCSGCHGAIVTAPLPPRITPGGTYSDELIVDVALSKFCDLIPVDRYAKMAGRSGLEGLPPHSLIQASFRLAKFMSPVYELIKREVLSEEVLRADETPHRMLEGDEKKRWYLWGFSIEKACFFECHASRSGDISTEVLKSSNCLILLSDVYSGYQKSIRLANEIRIEDGRQPILPAYCNAHARREFWIGDWDSPEMTEDQKIMIKYYKEIYKLNDESMGLSPEEILQKRLKMKPHFEAMKSEAEAKTPGYSSKSQMGSAYSYFLKNYHGLTLFLANHLVPIDNNGSERLLRSHVVGRKTWYGTHSPKGAEVAAVHFTVVETCKLNKLNPREFYLDVVQRIHSGQQLLTPSQYKAQLEPNTC
jgi:transposase